MLDSLLSLLFCLLVGFAGLATSAWVVYSGGYATMDGILLILISLTLGGIFLLDFAWSLRNGEAREILSSLRKASKSDTSSSHPLA